MEILLDTSMHKSVLFGIRTPTSSNHGLSIYIEYSALIGRFSSMVTSIVCTSSIYASNYSFGIFKMFFYSFSHRILSFSSTGSVRTNNSVEDIVSSVLTLSPVVVVILVDHSTPRYQRSN
jgi:hypothetical protein